MRTFIDERGQVRAGRIAPIARELGITRPDFDLADWAIKARGWVELTQDGPHRRRLRWRPSQLREATAIAARGMIIDTDPLGPVELLRWTERWHAEMADGMKAAWALGEAIGRKTVRPPTWRVTRRDVADLYRDHQLSLIEDLSRVAGRTIDRTSAAEIVEATPSGIVGMVERPRPGRPFTYIRVGRNVRLFDCPEAFVGRDLRESSDPAFSTACVPSYEIAAASDAPLIEDVEGPVVLADGRLVDLAYRRVLIRVSGGGRSPAIVMKTSAWLKPPAPSASADA